VSSTQAPGELGIFAPQHADLFPVVASEATAVH
jgi:hypothetical protein